eukprot:gene6491-11946_t
MVLLGNPFSFLDDQQADSSRRSESSCTCSPHSTAHEDFNKNKDAYKFCHQIHTTLSCLNGLRKNKNCSLSLYMRTLYTGTAWQFKKYNCLTVLKGGYSTLSPASPASPASPGVTRPREGSQTRGPSTNSRCVYKTKSVESLHCGLFGDPHLKTFSDKRQTCVVKGAWPMLNNKYFAVQVTNVLIDRNNPVATATSKITVLIKKSKHGCTRQKVYQAQVGYVPSTFRDGTIETGPANCKTRLVKEPNADGVRLYICYLNTTILIRKVGKYLTFNIRTPENYVRQSRGLCVTGCPLSEMIDYNGFFGEHPNSVLFGSAQPAMRQIDAVNQCKKANLTDFYYDSCVFDLISTGDSRFSNAAFRAMQDAVAMDPKLRLRRSNSVVLTYLDGERSNKPLKTSLGESVLPTSLCIVLPVLLWFLTGS